MAEDAERIVQHPLVTGEPSRNMVEPTTGMVPIAQYSLSKILLVWAAAAIGGDDAAIQVWIAP
jgi:hypothetical protein